ncbi:MAG: alpha/beta hydrolase [Bdellovibrionota bacterium]
MKRLLKTLLGFVFILAVLVPAQAMDVIDLYNGLQTWTMRWYGYRNYRIPVKLASGKSCIVALTAHVNPDVDQFTLLLHGFGDSRFMWWKWIEKYKDHPLYSSFIAVDLPLHGQTNCDSADDWDTIVDVIDQAVHGLGRAPISRIIGQSMGVVPAALLAERYPKAQQVWLTPPLLKSQPLKALIGDLLSIDTPVEVQVFLNRVQTKDREFPDFIRKEMLARIRKSQAILRKTKILDLDARILSRHYENLLIVTGAKDELVPPDELDDRVAGLTARPIEAVPCGHDVLRYCGEDVKTIVEQAHYRLDKATY